MGEGVTMADYRTEAVPGATTLEGAVTLLRSQGRKASKDSVRRFCRRRGIPLAKIGSTLLVPNSALQSYRHGRGGQ